MSRRHPVHRLLGCCSSTRCTCATPSPKAWTLNRTVCTRSRPCCRRAWRIWVSAIHVQSQRRSSIMLYASFLRIVSRCFGFSASYGRWLRHSALLCRPCACGPMFSHFFIRVSCCVDIVCPAHLALKTRIIIIQS